MKVVLNFGSLVPTWLSISEDRYLHRQRREDLIILQRLEFWTLSRKSVQLHELFSEEY